MNINLNIINVVATTTLNQSVNLDYLKSLFSEVVLYDPTAYQPPVPAYFKSKEMQGKVSIFPSGKMISVGTKNEERARYELKLVASYLDNAGIATLESPMKIQNMVAITDIGFKIELDSLKSIEGIEVKYEPKKFPGAIIKQSNLKNSKMATIVLFTSGKMVCVGFKRRKDATAAIQRFLHLIGDNDSELNVNWMEGKGEN